MMCFIFILLFQLNVDVFVNASNSKSYEFQRYDGWYNNRQNPHFGTKGASLIHKAPPAYGDGIKSMELFNRPSPGVISDKLLNGPDGIASSRNLTTMFAFFGQLVSGEIISTVSSSEIACPIEKTSVIVGEFGECSKMGNGTSKHVQCDNIIVRKVPFFRTQFQKNSGRYLNSYRKPINHVTSFIDGNFVYGTSQPWTDSLRSFVDGKLLVSEDDDDLPSKDQLGIPLVNLPDPDSPPRFYQPSSRYALGSFKSNQHPPLLALNILFHNYHNVIADEVKSNHSKWKDEQIFQRARQIVIATLQNIIVYEYLPLLVGQSLSPYSGYQQEVNPSISVEFQSAAFRFGHSMIPSGFFVVDPNCRKFRPVSFCSIWWNSSTFVKEMGTAAILGGMLVQIAEQGDHILSHGLRRHLFGLMRDSGQDLGALNIMRGRDVGVADFNSVRAAFGLKKLTDLRQINKKLFADKPELFQIFTLLYNNSINNVDLFVGGLLESEYDKDLPGETFRAIIIDQFRRIRDGDRFWFENENNEIFNEDEISIIRSTKISNVLERAGNLDSFPVPSNAFVYDNSRSTVCRQPYQLNSSHLEPCEQTAPYDFFSGSEFSFIMTFLLLAVSPTFCCLIACLISKQKTRRYRKSFVRNATKRMKDTFVVFEHVDAKATRKVQLKFGPGPAIQVMNKDACMIRTIDLHNRNTVDLRHSYNTTKCSVILMNVPKEYDLILVFPTVADRKEFASAIRHFLSSFSFITIKEVYLTRAEIFESAVFYNQRLKVLQNFFRTAFNQVFRAQHKHSVSFLPYHWPKFTSIRSQALTSKSNQQLFATELSRHEFAQALHLTPGSLFVEQMFAIADKDQNGFISYPEFIDILVILSKGSVESKMKMLFEMYDLDGSNDLDEEEFTTMIKSLVDMANSKLLKEQVDEMVLGMLTSCNLEQKKKLTFDDFYLLVQRYQNDLWADDKRELGFGFTKNERELVESSSTGQIVVKNKNEECQMVRFYRFSLYFLENNSNRIVFLVLFVLFTCYLFVDTATTCYFMREHIGTRKVLGFTACVARGSATALSFCYAFLLLSVCRNIMTVLRNTVVGSFFPFDAAVSFHRLVAWISLFLTVVHMVSHAINFYKIGTQPPIVLQCLFPSLQLDVDFMPKFDYWIFQTIPGVTGVLLFFFLSVMYVFGSHTARKHIFHTFWITHRLFIVVYALNFLHGTAELIQPPSFHWFTVGPVVIYVCDWLISLTRRAIELKIINVDILPSDVLHLSFKLPSNISFHSGQYIRIACEDISAKEFHPFTVTSAPYERILSCHIRAVGPWTRSMLDLFSACKSENRQNPKLYIDGPFGSSHQDWYKYEIVVLIGAGIGVTPNSSVLKDLVYKVYSQQSEVSCTHVYFAWISRNHSQFEWFTEVLREIEKRDVRNLIHMDIFVSQLVKDFDIRTTMLYICEHQFQRLSNRSLFTGLKAKTHFGRIDFDEYFNTIKKRHMQVSKIGVFSCGPKSLVRSVNTSCYKMNKSSGSVAFVPHHEIF